MKLQVPKDFAARIKQLRKKHDLTQTRLGERLGVSFASINRWENEQATPNKLAWQKIERAEALGLHSLEEKPLHQIQDEKAAYQVAPSPNLDIDFTTCPDIILTVAEGYRLAYGHQFNPAFATETSLIDPLPHQRIAVYENMLTQPRLRF
ncbi:MAG: helix-turn-helix transcriptional regulator, partial [Saprospiraceae bacterium]|nr:helix-turn-helix transcriptional regulator [Saprospiraceae bacterium]